MFLLRFFYSVCFFIVAPPGLTAQVYGPGDGEIPLDSIKCFNQNYCCDYWGDLGKCDHNDYMMLSCPATCKQCVRTARPTSNANGSIDYFPTKSCQFWVSTGQCQKNPFWMSENCRFSCGKGNVLEENFCSPEPPAFECLNESPCCETWVNENEGICKYNMEVRKRCRVSCTSCRRPKFSGCVDHYAVCEKRKNEFEGQCKTDWMAENCRKSCGLCNESKEANCGSRKRLITFAALIQQSIANGPEPPSRPRPRPTLALGTEPKPELAPVLGSISELTSGLAPVRVPVFLLVSVPVPLPALEPESGDIGNETSETPKISTGPRGNGTSEKPEVSTSPGGNETSDKPEASIGPGGNGTSKKPEVSTGPGGNETSDKPEVSTSPGGNETSDKPEVSTSPGGNETSDKPEVSTSPGGNEKLDKPEASIGPGGNETSEEPEVGTSPGGNETSEEPEVGTSPGGNETSEKPEVSTGPGGNETSDKPEVSTSPGGNETSDKPEVSIGPEGNETSEKPEASTGPGGNETSEKLEASTEPEGKEIPEKLKDHIGSVENETSEKPGARTIRSKNECESEMADYYLCMTDNYGRNYFNPNQQLPFDDYECQIKECLSECSENVRTKECERILAKNGASDDRLSGSVKVGKLLIVALNEIENSRQKALECALTAVGRVLQPKVEQCVRTSLNMSGDFTLHQMNLNEFLKMEKEWNALVAIAKTYQLQKIVSDLVDGTVDEGCEPEQANRANECILGNIFNILIEIGNPTVHAYRERQSFCKVQEKCRSRLSNTCQKFKEMIPEVTATCILEIAPELKKQIITKYLQCFAHQPGFPSSIARLHKSPSVVKQLSISFDDTLNIMNTSLIEASKDPCTRKLFPKVEWDTIMYSDFATKNKMVCARSPKLTEEEFERRKRQSRIELPEVKAMKEIICQSPHKYLAMKVNEQVPPPLDSFDDFDSSGDDFTDITATTPRSGNHGISKPFDQGILKQALYYISFNPKFGGGEISDADKDD